MNPTDDLQPTPSELVSEPVPDPARPALPPITRVNSRILYAAAIFGLIVIWVVTFTVTSRHPQTKPPAPPQVQDAAPNLDSLANLAERLRVAQEMQKKLAAQQNGRRRSIPSAAPPTHRTRRKLPPNQEDQGTLSAPLFRSPPPSLLSAMPPRYPSAPQNPRPARRASSRRSPRLR